jgi:hypothetical protein
MAERQAASKANIMLWIPLTMYFALILSHVMLGVVPALVARFMLWIALAIHFALIAFTRSARRRCNLVWTDLDTAICLAIPFAFFLPWILLYWVAKVTVIGKDWWPSTWSEQSARFVGESVVTLPPLFVFWIGFYWPELNARKVIRANKPLLSIQPPPRSSPLRVASSQPPQPPLNNLAPLGRDQVA